VTAYSFFPVVTGSTERLIDQTKLVFSAGKTGSNLAGKLGWERAYFDQPGEAGLLSRSVTVLWASE
jgi:hypothetical protein